MDKSRIHGAIPRVLFRNNNFFVQLICHFYYSTFVSVYN